MNGSPGDPYNGFNTGQVVETEFFRFSFLEAIAVHSTGGIYAFGTTWDTLDGTGKTAVISKYLATGALDITYDRDGKRYLNGRVIGAFDLSGVDMLVQRNEQLVFLANKLGGLGLTMSLVRLNADATPDLSFGQNDIIWPSGSFTVGGAITAAPNGDIIVAGHNDNGFWLSRRLYVDGSHDPNFGNGGFNLFPATDANCTDVVIDHEGRIIVVGWSLEGSEYSFVLLRFDAGGNIDTTFGNGTGRVTTSKHLHYPRYIDNRINSYDVARIGVQPDGKYVVGITEVIERYDAAGGQIDASFGTRGAIALISGGSPLLTHGLVIAPDGTILVAGMAAETDEVYVYSYNADGSADRTFGIAGRARILPLQRASALALRPEGRILVGGRTYQDESGLPPFRRWNFALTARQFNPGRHSDLVNRMLPYSSGLISAFQSGVAYYSPDAQNLGGGGNTMRVYGGIQGIVAIIPYQNGVLTAFNNGEVYFSPDGMNIGTGSLVNGPGKPPVAVIIQYKSGVITAFSDQYTRPRYSIYFSPDGQNLGGGGGTRLVYSGSQKVVTMIPYRDGVITAFTDGEIYFSPDGQNLGGGGGTRLVYSGSQKVVTMIPYKKAVITAFRDGGIFRSPDGQSLGPFNRISASRGGHKTFRVYSGSRIVATMIQYKKGVITAFRDGGIYHSSDGHDLGARVYSGTQRVVLIVAYQTGVITAFANSEIYLSRDGSNLGVVAGNTIRVY